MTNLQYEEFNNQKKDKKVFLTFGANFFFSFSTKSRVPRQKLFWSSEKMCLSKLNEEKELLNGSGVLNFFYLIGSYGEN